MSRTRTLGLTVAAAAALAAGSAAAQSINATSASYAAGWGRSTTSSNGGIELRHARDANNNRLIVDGVMQTGEDQSSYAHSDTGGAYDSHSGAGAPGTYTAIGNSLSVNVQGNWNTVIVDSTQINNGDVIAGDQRGENGELNGGVNLDD